MSTIATERLINRMRVLFILFFLIAAFSAYKGQSGPWSWGSILAATAIFTTLAIVNQAFILKDRISPLLIYISVTTEFLLVFVLKFSFHFVPGVGYGLAMKEPASFIVYFLFLIMTALRYNKRLNIYAGSLAIITYVSLLTIAVVIGGMRFTANVREFFNLDTLRVSTEVPKILFLLAFTYFIYKMAEFTTRNMSRLEEAEHVSAENLQRMERILDTVSNTTADLVRGSGELRSSSVEIDGILAKHGKLMSEVEQIAKEISESIEIIREKSNFQYHTVEENYLRIKDISGLMEKIHGDSSHQRATAGEALGLAEINEQKINDTMQLITGMKEDSKKIEEISRTISEIADKTNLLSLNAAIESARAGEHGRGFAVVADEISKLATMSVDSSKEIATIIRSTVGNIENASTTIEDLAGYLSKIISFVKENSGFMETLNRNTEKELDESRVLYSSFVEVDRAAKDVIENADRQNRFISQIIEWFENMRHLGREVATSLKGLQQLSNRLDERSNEMKSILDRK